MDDNPADIDLMSEVLAQCECPSRVHAVQDGTEALRFVRRQGDYGQAPHPDLVVLDLSLPRLDGRGVLTALKADRDLAKIPVLIFTTSQADLDITRCYELGANCYLRKPGNLADFVAVVRCMAKFWLGYASLPAKENR